MLYVCLSQKPEVGLSRFNGFFYERLMNFDGENFTPVMNVPGDVEDAFLEAFENVRRSAIVLGNDSYHPDSDVVESALAAYPLYVLTNNMKKRGSAACFDETSLRRFCLEQSIRQACVIPYSEDAVLICEYLACDDFLEWATSILRDVKKEGICQPLSEDTILIYDLVA